jgi:hypothetical protein
MKQRLAMAMRKNLSKGRAGVAMTKTKELSMNLVAAKGYEADCR